MTSCNRFIIVLNRINGMDEACYLASVENNTGFPEAMTHVIGTYAEA